MFSFSTSLFHHVECFLSTTLFPIFITYLFSVFAKRKKKKLFQLAEVVCSNNVLSKFIFFFRITFFQIFLIFFVLSNKRSFEIIKFRKNVIRSNDLSRFQLAERASLYEEVAWGAKAVKSGHRQMHSSWKSRGVLGVCGQIILWGVLGVVRKLWWVPFFRVLLHFYATIFQI